MISEAGVDIRSDPAEFFFIFPFTYRPDGSVYDISGNKYQIGILRIYHVHPACEFRFPVMVADMQVAGKYYPDRTFQGLFGADVQDFAVFVAVMESFRKEGETRWNTLPRCNVANMIRAYRKNIIHEVPVS